MTTTDWAALLRPRFRYGEIQPRIGGIRRGVGYQFYRVVPRDVMTVSVGLGLEGYTREAVKDALRNIWPCVDALAREEVDWMVLGDVLISVRLGRAEVLDLIVE